MATLKRKKADGTWEYIQMTGEDVEQLRSELDTQAAQLAETQTQLSDIVTVNIRDFGAIPISENTTFDNTNAINNAVASMSDGHVLLLPGIGGKWRIDGTVIVDKAIKIIGNNATLEYYGTGTAIKFGKDNAHLPTSDSGGVYLDISDISLVNKSANNTTTVGVEFCNVIQSISDNFTVKDFGINWLMVGRNSRGCSQNTFYNQRLFNGGINLKFKCELNGWVTENTWVKGQNKENTAGQIALDISETDNFKPNNNHFRFVNFENPNSDTVINIDKAHENTFESCRYEGFKAGAIKLGVNSYGNAFLYGYGNSGIANAMFSDQGNNTVTSSYGRTNFVGTSSNTGIVTGKNLSDTSNRGFPVFFTHNKTNPNAYAFGIGHNAIAGYRADRQDYPFYYVDALTGKMYLTSGYFPIEEQPYMTSTGKGVIRVMNDTFTDIAVQIGDGTKPAFLLLGTYYLWVDSAGKLRIHTSKPTNTDTQGTVVGSQT